MQSLLIHGGNAVDEHTGAVNIPIYQTSTYRQIELGVQKGYEYSRTGNPTREALENLSAELEGGVAGFAFASGMAAITAVLSLFQQGDKVIISSNVYGGTFRVLDKIFNRFGIGYEIVDTTDLTAFEASLVSNVKAVLLESPANPLLTVTDIQALATIAKKYGVLTVVDNTFMTPYLQRPILLGADIVLHSATKYLGGHSDLVAGIAVVNDKQLAEKIHFIQNATGGILQPFDSFLLIRGIKTLGVRMDRHTENALYLAEKLKENSAVKHIYYPGLQSDVGYELNAKQAKNGGAMISFVLKEKYNFRTFFKELKLVALAESLGGVESLVCHPASMTHASIPKEIREKVGITESLIRLSVGIEYKEDILNDVLHAIEKSKE
jgi:Cystathionine beta-lyases/cystathionine gamma-synthases